MTLIVSSGVGELVWISAPTPVMASVATLLTAAHRSFYCEPLSNNFSQIAVDKEHEPTLRAFINEVKNT